MLWFGLGSTVLCVLEYIIGLETNELVILCFITINKQIKSYKSPQYKYHLYTFKTTK